MKKVKIEGKLTLKKEVVAKLNELQLNIVRGGRGPDTKPCAPTASICASVCNSNPCC